jgi:tetratricopeptide (TPR) repeat protein
VAAAVLPYGNTLWNGFVYDDNQQILENPYIQSPQFLREIVTTTVWSFQGEQGVSNYYRPLMMLSFLACWLVFGPVAAGFHLVNVLLHAVVVALVYEVARRLFRDARIAFVAALLFAAHPIHSEAVAWVAAIPDLQLSVLVLTIFLLLLHEPQALSSRSVWGWRRMATVPLFALALLAKEPAMLFPALILFFEHFVRPGRDQTPWPEKAGRYTWFWVILALYLPLRIVVSGGFAPALYRPQLSWTETLLTSFALTAKYVAKLVWPAHLSAFYPFAKNTSLLETQVLAGLAILLVSVLLFVWMWRQNRVAAFSLLWTYVILAPVLNAQWMPASVFAERYLYLPSVGSCWLVGWALVWLWDRVGEHRRGWRIALGAALALVALAGCTRTAVRNLDWRDDFTLYTRTLQVHPDAHLMRLNLGFDYWRRGKLAEAELEWNTVLEKLPKNVVIINNIAQVRLRLGRYREGVELLERALRIRPEYVNALVNLGLAFEGLKEPQKAFDAYARAARYSPLNPLAQNHLAAFYVRSGRDAEAETHYRASLAARPTPEAARGLGELLRKRGDLTGAEAAFARAVELNPYDEQAQLYLAQVYEALGKRIEAVRAYQVILEANPSHSAAGEALERLRKTAPSK